MLSSGREPEYTTIALLPALSGAAKPGALLHFWVLVYVANLAGGGLMALAIATIGPGLGVIDVDRMAAFAHALVDPAAPVVGGAIGFAHLHHAITGTIEVSVVVSLGGVPFASLVTLLLWTTLRNVIGRVLFAVPIRYALWRAGSTRDTAAGRGKGDG